MVRIQTDKFSFENIKIVIFDKDGTILDLHKYWSFLIKERAIFFSKLSMSSNTNKIKEDLACSMGLIESNKLSPNGPIGIKPRAYIIDLVFNLLKKYNEDIDIVEIENGFQHVDKIADNNLDKIIHKLPGVDELLQTLKTYDCLIAMATSDISKRALNNLNHANIIDFFDCVVGSDQVDNPKPNCEIIEKILSNFNNILPSEVVLIGDSIIDLKTAENSGVNFIGVNTGSSTDILFQESDFCVDSLLEIKISNIDTSVNTII